MKFQVFISNQENHPLNLGGFFRMIESVGWCVQELWDAKETVQIWDITMWFSINGGTPKYPKIWWKILLTWKILGYSHFRKPPYDTQTRACVKGSAQNQIKFDELVIEISSFQFLLPRLLPGARLCESVV